MGKKKQKAVADQVRRNRGGQNKKVNPFEVKVNRQKHDILGRKVGKFEKGMPGVSRLKANKRVMFYHHFYLIFYISIIVDIVFISTFLDFISSEM